MALGDRIAIGRFGMAAIAAAVVTALAVASPGPAWGQDTGDQAGARAASQAETMAPAGMMQMMMGTAGDDGDPAPLTGHGFLLDKGIFTTIDHPDAVAETAALGINNRGQIVGGYVDVEGTIRSFLLDDGVFTPIDHPDVGSGPGTIAFGLNDRGQIVGFYIDADGAVHGFLLDKGPGFRRAPGVFTTIDHPDAALGAAPFTAASGIDNRGRIVGAYADAEGRGHGFVLDKGRGARRDKGVFTPIDFPGARGATVAQAINDRGQIVGFYNPSEATPSKRGFLLDDGEFTTIDHPDATFEISGGGTALFGINNRGQIVGQYSHSSCHGFLLDTDTFTTIDDPDALFATGVADINGRGQIVGFYDGMTGIGQCASQGASTNVSDPGSAAD
jgi:uncharacterized membrane protein